MIPFVLIAKLINQVVATVGGNLNTHILDYNNPHQVTKAQVGLNNVDNTSDINKPVSTLQQIAIDKAVLASLTPYFIPAGETFHIPLNKQAVAGMDIIVDGFILADGFLVEVM